MSSSIKKEDGGVIMTDEKITTLKNKLEDCNKIDIENVNIDDVEDISNIKIDTKKSSVERILDFLLSYENPYIFKVQNSLVKIEFSNSNVYADNCVTNVFRNIYK